MDILNISQIIPLPIQCAEVCGGIFKTPTLLQMHNGIEVEENPKHMIVFSIVFLHYGCDLFAR